MDAPSTEFGNPCDLESVITTEELNHRPTRSPDLESERRALLDLTRDLARWPKEFFSKLVKYVLKLSHAQSSGISLLNEEEGRFVWPAVAGKLGSFLGGGTPSDLGPCATVLQRGMTLLFKHPERHFTSLAPITPPLEEVLLVPFYVNQKAVGTIWAVNHEPDRKFEPEDRRLLESLSTFAASAYRTLAGTGELEPLLRVNAGIGL
jgi:GAF domain-containing protein